MVKCQSKINTIPFFRIAHKWNRIICIFVRNVIRRRRKHFDHSVIIVWAIYLVTKLFYFIFRTSLDAFMRSFNVWSIENKTAINVSSAILLVRTWTSILFFSIFFNTWCVVYVYVWTQWVLAKRLLLLQIYLLFITISTNYFNLFVLFQILAGAKRNSHHFRHSPIPFPVSCLFVNGQKVPTLIARMQLFPLLSSLPSQAKPPHKHFRQMLMLLCKANGDSDVK